MQALPFDGGLSSPLSWQVLHATPAWPLNSDSHGWLSLIFVPALAQSAVSWQAEHGLGLNCASCGSAWQASHVANAMPFHFSGVPWHFSQPTPTCLPVSGNWVNAWSKRVRSNAFQSESAWHLVHSAENLPAWGSL